jgi:hypothetical protein
MKPVSVATFISTLLSALVGALPTLEEKKVTASNVTYTNFNRERELLGKENF